MFCCSRRSVGRSVGVCVDLSVYQFVRPSVGLPMCGGTMFSQPSYEDRNRCKYLVRLGANGGRSLSPGRGIVRAL